MTKDYKMLLPKTNFSQNANIAATQQIILEKWNSINLEDAIQKKNDVNPKEFIIHLGPPYATGELHKGHLLNYILKDFTIRSYFNLGYKVSALQGWDCHGLPIEMKVLEKTSAVEPASVNEQGDKNSNTISSVIEFRKDCMNFANKWINIQAETLRNLGFAGQINNHYTTMQITSQLSIVNGFFHILKNNLVFRKRKTTMWSTVEKTTLSDAEINYNEKHISKSAYFVSRLKNVPKMPDLVDHFITVWTTTPWTLPGNNGYAYHNELNYQVVRIGLFIFIAAEDLVSQIIEKIKQYQDIKTENEYEVLRTFKGSDLEGATASHPIYDFDVPLLHGDFVGNVEADGKRTGGKGTGLVHIAGAHGLDDFELSNNHNLTFYDHLDEEGYYKSTVGDPFLGLHALHDQQVMIDYLRGRGTLLAQEDYKHRYPYSERGKNPIIFKLSYQWFIDIDKSSDDKTLSMRKMATESTENVNWIPVTGKNRMLGMLKTRKEWVISRQRLWGVPIMWFTRKDDGAILMLPREQMEEITNKILDNIKTYGYEFWYSHSKEELSTKFLPLSIAHEYTPSMDILDVWFESGMTHDYVVRKGDKNRISDIYIEGSDQHRGWFQSSLLTSVAIYGNAPYKTVMTHGFVLDEKGEKMSKSRGNTETMTQCINNYGNDVMRIWVASSDFTEEIRIGNNSIQRAKEMYQTIRNRFKFILGVLNNQKIKSFGFSLVNAIEKYILARIFSLQEQIDKNILIYNFRENYYLLQEFCNNDLSKMYFVCRKDSWYCDSVDNSTRLSSIFVMDIVMKFLLHNYRVFLPFLCEEVRQNYELEVNKDNNCVDSYNPYSNQSIHLEDNFIIDNLWKNEDIILKFQSLETIGSQIMQAIEQAIQQGIIKTVTEAKIIMTSKELIDENKELLQTIYKFAEIELIKDDESITIHKTTLNKCDRCWNYTHIDSNNICSRCIKVLS